VAFAIEVGGNMVINFLLLFISYDYDVVNNIFLSGCFVCIGQKFFQKKSVYQKKINALKSINRQ
jgi:hypothetical protein